MARYRKEATGGMDETELRALESALDAATRLEERRASVLSAIDNLGKLTPELRSKIEDADVTAAALEDLYLPYKAKRRTKASVAREAGLQPLADAILRPQRLTLGEGAPELLERHFEGEIGARAEGQKGSNGRGVRNLLEAAKRAQALRLAEIKRAKTLEDLTTLTAEDCAAACGVPPPKKKEEEKKKGFFM